MREQLFDLLRRLPVGSVTSYGALGAALDPPVSGYLVGRAMATCPYELPWWRVVARDGAFSLAKRSPEAALEQRRRLGEEGVPLLELGVDPSILLHADDLLAL